jgi:long-chain fatty acid transport protein
MKRFLMASAAVVAGTTGALAGGIDRSGQGIGFMFEKGTYAEFSFGYVAPSVEPAALPLGDVLPNYTTLGFAYKRDFTDKLSFGLQIDQPYGAHVQYPAGAPLVGTYAELWSVALNAIGRYKFNDSFSAHGGLSYVSIDGRAFVPGRGVAAQSFSADGDIGYLVGVAFEKPEIALRVALTYYSGTDHALDSSVGTVGTVNPPQAINLDFQTGIAADTLLFGQIRWADWSETEINIPPASGAAPLLTYAEDRVSYTLGVGRKFNDTWSGAVSVGYEETQGGTSSLLSPTDGYTSVGMALTYTKDNMKVTGGVRYVDVGDASTLIGAFSDNSAVAVGLRVGYSF